MEAIDNKYLIIVKGDGTIDAALVDEEVTVKDKSGLLNLMAKGWTIIIKGRTICNVNANKNLSETKEIYVDNATHMFFPSTFKSYEQASISLELFNYFSNKVNIFYNFYDEEAWTLSYAFKGKAREKLEKEKNRYEIEYISKNALMLIYPDGKVESVLEDFNLRKKDNYHLYYYTKLYKRSNKLKELLPNFKLYKSDDIMVNHNEVDNDLVKNGIIVFLNQDIGLELGERTHPLSYFRIFIPKNYGSVNQTEKIEDILKKYPEHRMSLGKWDDTEKRCTSTYVTDVLSDAALKKKLIRKEGK